MRIEIDKAARRLTAIEEDGTQLFSCAIALGKNPVGPKLQEGDGKTPEGEYFICLKKRGKYGPSLGISYPNEDDGGPGGRGTALLISGRQQGVEKEFHIPLGPVKRGAQINLDIELK